jgi:polysaccharide export outer membrane protein
VPNNQDYRLGAGDAIGVQVYQSPDLSIDARVSESGVISYPLVGSVQLGGLTIAEAEKKIGDALRTGGFVKVPQVNIVLLQVRGNQVAVLGQVQKPGRFPLETTTTRVSDLLAAAGGVTPMGDDTLIVTGTARRPAVPQGDRHPRPVPEPAQLRGHRGPGRRHHLHQQGAHVYYIYGEAQKPRPVPHRARHDGAAGPGPGRRPHPARQHQPKLRLTRTASRRQGGSKPTPA